MTTDIGKFIRNEAELLMILGSIRISIWNFVVPYWNNKDLLKHARGKETEIRNRRLKHAAKDFTISVITHEEFEAEERLLANLDVYQFDVSAPPTEPASIAVWMKGRSRLQLVANLARKAAIIGSGKALAREEQTPGSDRCELHWRQHRPGTVAAGTA